MTLSLPTNGHFAQSVRAAKNDTSTSYTSEKPAVSPNQASNHKKSEPHLRRTTAQVKQKWLLGDYTASGYLVELFASMKAEGLAIVIRNVAQFCKEWGIGERRFYRAKAKLIDQGRLEEEIKGTLIVRLVGDKSDHLYDDKNVSDHDSNVSLTDKNVSDHDSNVSLTPSNPLPESSFEDSPDLSSDLDQISLSQPTHPPERETKILSQNKIKEEFREWLVRRSNELPTKPAFLDRWISVQMTKPEIQQEFLKYREAQGLRQNVPPAPLDFPAKLDDYVYPLAQISETDQRLNNLARLQAKWKQPALQAAAIAEAKKHGFVVTPNGIEEA